MNILADLKKSREAYRTLDTELNNRTATLESLSAEYSQSKISYSKLLS